MGKYHGYFVLAKMVLAVALMAGCSAKPIESSGTATPPAPASSPTYTPTPVVATATATTEPTATPTHEPTATATEQPTATPEGGFDFSLIHNLPADYDDFFNGDRSPYLKVPNPVDDPAGWAKFLKLYEEHLGPTGSRIINIDSPRGAVSSGPGQPTRVSSEATRIVKGQPDFFFFEYNKVFYPCYGLTAGAGGYPVGTIIMVPQNTKDRISRGSEFGTQAMELLAKGNFSFIQLTLFTKPHDGFTLDMVKLVEAGLNSQAVGNDNRIWPGFANIAR